MSSELTTSIHALAQAVLGELERANDNLEHGVIRISCKSKLLPNGISNCSVQVECNAGCGWLVDAFGDQAEILERKALAIQKILNGGVEEPQKSLSEILLEVFPEFIMKSLLAAGKGPKAFIA